VPPEDTAPQTPDASAPAERTEQPQ